MTGQAKYLIDASAALQFAGVDADVGQVVQRRRRRDRVDGRRNVHRNRPRPCHRRRRKPHAAADREEARLDADNRHFGVHDIGEFRSIDGTELRRAIELRRERRAAAARHARCLRNRVRDRGFLCLSRPCHGGQNNARGRRRLRGRDRGQGRLDLHALRDPAAGGLHRTAIAPEGIDVSAGRTAAAKRR